MTSTTVTPTQNSGSRIDGRVWHQFPVNMAMPDYARSISLLRGLTNTDRLALTARLCAGETFEPKWLLGTSIAADYKFVTAHIGRWQIIQTVCDLIGLAAGKSTRQTA